MVKTVVVRSSRMVLVELGMEIYSRDSEKYSMAEPIEGEILVRTHVSRKLLDSTPCTARSTGWPAKIFLSPSSPLLIAL